VAGREGKPLFFSYDGLGEVLKLVVLVDVNIGHGVIGPRPREVRFEDTGTEKITAHDQPQGADGDEEPPDRSFFDEKQGEEAEEGVDVPFVAYQGHESV